MGERLAAWVRKLGIVDVGVDPNHGWHHSFKTRGRRGGMRDSILDAIQGHAPQTEGRKYGGFKVDVMEREMKLFPGMQSAPPNAMPSPLSRSNTEHDGPASSTFRGGYDGFPLTRESTVPTSSLAVLCSVPAAVEAACGLPEKEWLAAQAAAAQELRDLLTEVRCHTAGSVTVWTGDWGFRIHINGDVASIECGGEIEPGKSLALRWETRDGVVSQPFLPIRTLN
ncbi:hypothetical protein [Methylobacterium sp. 88A]|uniref:hypothetical protein n=1 Tax=Methylobacterium sp. 88A TaxID=1131813 RepID=UPI0004756630|nr:hypothetical protein [Methylobacterium sp. 88A]